MSTLPFSQLLIWWVIYSQIAALSLGGYCSQRFWRIVAWIPFWITLTPYRPFPVDQFYMICHLYITEWVYLLCWKILFAPKTPAPASA